MKNNKSELQPFGRLSE